MKFRPRYVVSGREMYHYMSPRLIWLGLRFINDAPPLFEKDSGWNLVVWG